MNRRRICSLVFAFMVAIGLLCQSSIVIEEYFQYKVSSKTHVFIPEVIQPHSISFCMRFTDILNYDQLNKETKRNWSFADAKMSTKAMEKYVDEMTVDEIFKYTPSEGQLLSTLRFRNRSSSHVFEFHDHRIYECLNITKYIYMRFICYHVVVVCEDDEQYFQELVAVPTYPGQIHVMDFHPLFHKTHYMKVVLGFRDKFPSRELVTTNYITRYYNMTTDSARSNYLVSQDYEMTVESLPPPFETRCINYSLIGFENEVDCMHHCIMKLTKKVIGKLPYTIPIRNSTKDKMISDIDLYNKTIDRTVRSIQNDCSRKFCSRVSCHHTQVMVVSTVRSGAVFRWKHVIPSQPSFRIENRPALPLIAFLIYLLSIMSTWTGCSILSFNPFRILPLVWKNVTEFRSISTKRSFETTSMSSGERVQRLEVKIKPRSIVNRNEIMNHGFHRHSQFKK